MRRTSLKRGVRRVDKKLRKIERDLSKEKLAEMSAALRDIEKILR